MKAFLYLLAIATITATTATPVLADDAANKSCPDYLNHSYRKLHSTDTINLCNLYTGKPILLINTASHCGYTRQFKPLEALYQKYKAQGFEIVGFSSDDFNQEAKDEAKAAAVCYKNYGVTFTMLAPTHVKGEDANPTFAYLAQQTEAPSWNFNKYLTKDGSVQHAGSSTKPLGSKLEEELKALLK